MGNCCGKAEEDPFANPGRVLGAAPPQPKTAPVPTKRTVGGPPRPLGGSSSGEATASGGSDAEARRRAADAAEARAKGGKPTGKLGDQLQAQRKQTRTDTLKEASADTTRRREMDATQEALSHN